jgi:predicted  nucleic acid-binding Zn-ribbon protein
MHETAFDQFIALVEMDQRAQHLAKQSTTLLLQKQTIEKQLESIHDEVEQAHQHMRTLQKRIDALDLELKVVDAQERGKKERINNAATTREYYSLEQEIASLSAQRSQYEETLFELWNQLEQAQRVYTAIMETAPQQITSLESSLASIDQQIDYITTQIQVYNHNRGNYTAGIDPELLQQYENMKTTTDNPVVAVANNSCTGCFYPINQQNLAELRHNKLVTCKQCFRLLYIPGIKTA